MEDELVLMTNGGEDPFISRGNVTYSLLACGSCPTMSSTAKDQPLSYNRDQEMTDSREIIESQL